MFKYWRRSTKPDPYAKLECWIDPTNLPPSRAINKIAGQLKDQYDSWTGKSTNLIYKKLLDCGPDQLKSVCQEMRQKYSDRRVLFHYNGHGVPEPTNHGELWCFNSNYTEYLPVSICDIAQWLGTPSVIVSDCSDAGKIYNTFRDYQVAMMRQKQLFKKNNNNNNEDSDNDDSLHDDKAEELNFYDDETILFASCDDGELLPNNPDYPADILTSCLASSMKMEIKFFSKTSVLSDVRDEIIDLLFDPSIGGTMKNKKKKITIGYFYGLQIQLHGMYYLQNYFNVY